MFKNFFRNHFALFHRVNRRQYIIAVVVAVALTTPVAILREELLARPNLSRNQEFMIWFNLLAWVGLVAIYVWSSYLHRRLRDIGLGSLIAFPLMGLAVYALVFAGPSLVGGMFLAAIVFSPMIFPAWDRQMGFTHVAAVLRRIATVDGNITDAERQTMLRLCDDPYRMPDHVKERVMRDFETGHQESISIEKHIAMFKRQLGKDEAHRANFARMAWMMANSNGKPSSERVEMARKASTLLDVEPDEYSDPKFNSHAADDSTEQGILPPRAKNIVGLLAKMAKADGVIEKAEIQMVSDFFEYGMGLPPDLKKAAIDYFRKVKDDPHTYKHYADLCIRDVTQIPKSEADEAKHGIFGLLIELASADGEIHQREAEILEYVADKFGISNEYGNSQRSESKEGGRSERTSSASGKKDEKYYAKILQIGPNASKDEIKKAWREMIKSNHPDKVSHMSQAIQEFAAEQTKLAQEAYEFFKRRGRA